MPPSASIPPSLACLAGSVAGLLVQVAWGGLPAPGQWPASGLAWLGNVVGVCLGAPVALSLVGQPRGE